MALGRTVVGRYSLVGGYSLASYNVQRGWRIICVHRKSAMGLPPSSSETVASHTCVVRPPWTSFASHLIAPPRLVPTKLLFSSMVVKLSAPSGRFTNVPYPHEVSARATTVAACR